MKEKFKEGMKFDLGKLRYDLLSPEALKETVRVLTFGSVKYGDNNWRKGLKFGRVFGALMRHLWDWWWGEELDPETGISHLSHASCCLMFLSHYNVNYKEYKQFDDRPKYIENRLKTKGK